MVVFTKEFGTLDPDPPTYCMFFGHFWMFAVKMTEWLFSLKSLGLLTPTYPKFGTKSQKTVIFDTFPYLQ